MHRFRAVSDCAPHPIRRKSHGGYAVSALYSRTCNVFLLLAQEAKPSKASSPTCLFWATEPQPCGTGCFSTYYSHVMLRPKADGDERERGQADRVSFLL